MKENYFESETFTGVDFAETELLRGDYEDCRFVNCNFAGVDFANVNFVDCEFSVCDLSGAKLSLSSMKNLEFIDCKLTGLLFEHCNPFLFEVSFEKCILNFSSFAGMKLKKTIFRHSSLHEVDFTETDLAEAVFDHCDLKGTIFEQTILEKADLRTSYNYSFSPAANKIKKAKFSLPAVLGLLREYDIIVE